MFKLDKRKKFIITAIILTLGLLVIHLGEITWCYQAIAILAVLTYFLSAWSLKEGLNGIEWLTVLALPVLFTISVGLFYFLTPTFWWARVPIIILYGGGIYGLLLTENIFSVAAIRTIQLVRSAHAVSFLLTLATSFFVYNVIFSFRQPVWVNLIAVLLFSFPLILQGLWCINLEPKIEKSLWFKTIALSLVMGEMALVFSFWPVSVAVGSLSLTTSLYITLGLTQQYLNERLFKKTINEYIAVGIAVLIVILLTTRWGG